MSNVVKNKGHIFNKVKSLKEYESSLFEPWGNFMRIQNSFIININYVKSYVTADGGFIIMSDDKKITISREKKSDFLRLINKAKE